MRLAGMTLPGERLGRAGHAVNHGGGVANGTHVRKVSISHGIRGYVPVVERAGWDPHQVVGTVKERLVPDDGTADRPCAAMFFVRHFIGDEGVAGVEEGVGDVVERPAMKLVRSSAARHSEIRHAAELRRVIDRHHLQFLEIEHVLGEVDGAVADHAVHRFRYVVAVAALSRKPEGPAAHVRLHVRQCGHVGLREERLAAERRVNELLVVESVGHLRAFGLNHSGIRRDIDGGSDLPDHEGNIDPACFPAGNPDLVGHEIAEPGGDWQSAGTVRARGTVSHNLLRS